MSWDCPHLTRDYYCNRLKIKCDPSCKGCVLHGKVISLTGTIAGITEATDKEDEIEKSN